MPKKLIWERTTSKLQLYITQDRYELKTPLMTIPFTSKSKMMVYLQQRYHLDMQEYRQIYDAGFLTGTPVKKEDIKMTASSFKPIKEENLQKRNGSELAQKNQEEAREKITTLAKNFEADPSTLADYSSVHVFTNTALKIHCSSMHRILLQPISNLLKIGRKRDALY